MTTPLLLSLLLHTVELWDGSAMLDFNRVDFGKQTVANALKYAAAGARCCVLHCH